MAWHPLVLPLSLLFIFFIGGAFATTRCRLFHEYKEDGKWRRITPAVCHGNEFCVHAFYSDTNSSRKNGYSKGCDQNDCNEARNCTSDGCPWPWKVEGDYFCRADRDYGDGGRRCCCRGHMCNEASSITFTFLLLIPFMSIMIRM